MNEYYCVGSSCIYVCHGQLYVHVCLRIHYRFVMTSSFLINLEHAALMDKGVCDWPGPVMYNLYVHRSCTFMGKDIQLFCACIL